MGWSEETVKTSIHDIAHATANMGYADGETNAGFFILNYVKTPGEQEHATTRTARKPISGVQRE